MEDISHRHRPHPLPVARVMNGTRARQNPFDGRHHGGGVGGVGGGGIKTRSEFYDRRDLLSFGAMHKPIYFGIPPAGSRLCSQTNISSDKKREGDRVCRLSSESATRTANRISIQNFIHPLTVGTSLVKWRRRGDGLALGYFFAHHFSRRI